MVRVKAPSENIISKTKSILFRKSGFTLMEIIVVLFIVIFMLSMSVPFFSRFSKGSKLKSAASNIASVLRTARSYAVAKNRNFYVLINDEKLDNLYYAVKIYDSNEGTVGKWYQLPQGIEVDSLTFNKEYAVAEVPFPHDSDSAQEKIVIEFKPNGGVKYGGSIYIKDIDGKYRRIDVINTTGRVKVTNEEPD
ncbi:MAG: prepilin-type N-terminal cleavage/methylation domain-containing protein [Candidatus Omnitrophota bacterium]